MTENVSESLKDTFEDVLEEADAERASASIGDGAVQLLLLVDVGSVLERMRESDEGVTEAVETPSMPMGQQESESGGQGRSALTRLFLAGAAVGLAYVLRRRVGSVDRAVSGATERAQSLADQTAERTSEIAEQTATVTDDAADRIEEGSDRAADQIESTGEAAAESVDETGDAAAESVENLSEEQMEGRTEEDVTEEPAEPGEMAVDEDIVEDEDEESE